MMGVMTLRDVISQFVTKQQYQCRCIDKLHEISILILRYFMFLVSFFSSTTLLTDESGAVLNRYDYEPFGKPTLSVEGVGNNPYQFVGQWGVRKVQELEVLL